MFNKPPKKHDASPAIHTILGKETLWKGEIHTGNTSLRVEGRVEGTVQSEGEVIVAPTGIIHGTIHTKHLIVTGRVEGVIRVTECLEIHGTGCVEGDVEVGSLVVDEGGTLQGTCTRKGVPSRLTLPTLPAPAEEPLTAEVVSESHAHEAEGSLESPDGEPKVRRRKRA